MTAARKTSFLCEAQDIDFATVELDYEGFRALAQNAHLSPHEKIGFPDTYRQGFEAAIFEDICSKLPSLREAEEQVVLDIGAGCAALPHMLIDLCRQRRHKLVLVDSPEMLRLLPDIDPTTHKCPGLFPHNLSAVRASAKSPVNAVLCYSVLHYIQVDANLSDFIDSVHSLLAPGGRALVGDIPNASKRQRFFASERGRQFHAAFTGSKAPYAAPKASTGPIIDDEVLCGLIKRAQAKGSDAYLVPQDPRLPMANRRDDLLLIQP